MKPKNGFEVEQRILSEFKNGYCSHPNANARTCSVQISNSHAIQRNGGLSKIAKNGHVLTVKPRMKDLVKTKGNPDPWRIGIRKASVFPGFCSKHDAEIFKPIEGKRLEICSETAFLFSYRAIAYEAFVKSAQIIASEAQRELDCGKPFEIQVSIQQQLHYGRQGSQLGLRDINAWKALFDDHLLNRERNEFHFLAIKFDQILPIVAAGVFQPEFDFNGNTLQKFGRSVSSTEHITLTITAFEDCSYAIFGWFGEAEGPPDKLIASLMGLKADRAILDAIINLLFSHIENVFFSEEWWRSLSAKQRSTVKKLGKSGTVRRERNPKEFFEGKDYFEGVKIESWVNETSR